MNDDINEYFDYTEIAYLLNSELTETVRGVEKLIQRMHLFDLPKRHIPYILLIHKVFYNIKFPLSDKKKAIDLLISDLNRQVIQKSQRNQLLDFFPEYYIYKLLLELFMAGYKIDGIGKKLKNHSGPLNDLIAYTDFSMNGVPESFKKFSLKFIQIRNTDQFLNELASAVLNAGNFRGFFYLLDDIKDTNIRADLLVGYAVAEIKKNETGTALKIAESMKDARWKSVCYAHIADVLASLGKIEILLEIRRTVSAPESEIGLVIALMKYHKQYSSVTFKSLIKEAFILLDKIKDYHIRSLHVASLMWIAHVNRGFNLVERCLIEFITLDCSIDNHGDKKTERSYFCRMLIIMGRTDEALEFYREWNMTEDNKNDYWQYYNLNAELQIMVKQQLLSIDTYISLDVNHYANEQNDDLAKLYKSALLISEVIEDNSIKEDSLHLIALNMARHGLFSDAFKIQDTLKETYFSTIIISKVPMYALVRGDVREAQLLASMITDQKSRLSVQLCMTLHLEEMNCGKDSAESVIEWANYMFQYD